MTGSSKIRIFSTEDNDVIRLCLRSFLGKIEDFELVGEAPDAVQSLALVERLKPDVALVDIGLPGVSGIELTKQIKRQFPQVRVMMLTASDDVNDIFASLDAGADGYAIKGDLSVNLEMAIRSVRLGAVWLDPRIARQVLDFSARSKTVPASTPAEMRLSAEEQTTLEGVALSNCHDGVCLVDPSFVERLKRFSAARPKSEEGAANFR